MNDFMFNMIRSELEDVVGRDNVSVTTSDKISHSVDYFCFLDFGKTGAE